MNRKADTHTPGWLIFSVTALIVGAIIMYGVYWDNGLFPGAKSAANEIWKQVPNVSIGAQELKASNLALEGKLEGEVNELKAVLDIMIGSPNQNCFEKFAGFSADLGQSTKEGNKIFFNTNLESGTPFMAVTIQNDKDQVPKQWKFAGARPCVIAGPSNEAKNFFDHFISGVEVLNEPYYSVVVGATLLYQNNLGDINGNTLRVLGWPDSGPVNDEGNNLQNGGLLFKGKGKDICFIPTNAAYNYNEDGIDDNYVSDEGVENSLLSRYNSGSDKYVKKCH